MVPEDPFASARRRIASGKRHLTNYELELRAYGAKGPHAIFFEPDAEAGWTVLRIKTVIEFPTEIEDLVFDVLCNLRSALDNATYATCTLGPDGKQNPRKSGFPFGLDAKEVRSRATGNSSDIPIAIFDYCAAQQPHKGGNDLLWALNNACNINKHKLITPAASARWQQLVFGQDTLIKFIGDPADRMKWDRTKNEMVLFAVPTPEAANYKIDVGLVVAFGEIEILAGEEVFTTLNAMARMVEDIVGGIETESRRIGFLP